MRKHLSVFMLAARFALWPTLIVSLAGAAATFYMLRSGCTPEIANIVDGQLFELAAKPVTVGALLLCALLMLPLRERGGAQPGYTLRRLSVSEAEVFFLQSAAYALAVFAYVMAQCAVCFGFGLWLQSNGGGAAGSLSVLAGFVNSSVTHAMLPMGDLAVYVRMACVYATLGMAAAYSAFMGRRGRFAISPFVVMALAAVGLAFRAFTGELGHNIVVLFFCGVICFGFISSVNSREKDEEDVEGED